MVSNSGTVHIENDLERSVFGSLRCMCGTCARDLLSTCTCETAEEARTAIRAKLKAGETRDQVLAEYQAEYGSDAMAVPPNHGLLRAIWAVPVFGIAVGAVGLARMMKRWRMPGGGPTDTAPVAGGPTGVTPDVYDARLDEELKHLDE
jgi:cytochrome c-type biogenesis protein CcmH/NrfF